MNKIDFVIYHITKFFVCSVLRIFYNLKIENNYNIPKSGGVLLVGNHSSWIDTIILSAATKRTIWFATGDFILDVPIMRSIVKHLCIIPMRRHNGEEAIKNVIKKLNEGNVVCIFPEGELTNNGKVKRFRSGVAVIQKNANVPIVPFRIKGAYNAWSLKQKLPKLFIKIGIKFGKPFYPTCEKNNDIASEIRNVVKATF